eukprot:scaffold197_cov268-Chaetoceros_neogracile.AAC.25
MDRREGALVQEVLSIMVMLHFTDIHLYSLVGCYLLLKWSSLPPKSQEGAWGMIDDRGVSTLRTLHLGRPENCSLAKFRAELGQPGH